MTEFYSFLEHLLYDHECVIIPQFGGFVVNAEDFSFNEKEGKIYPKKYPLKINQIDSLYFQLFQDQFVKYLLSDLRKNYFI